MKIKPEHVEEMRAGFATWLAENPGLTQAHRASLQTLPRYQPNGDGDIDKRIRWDVLRVSKGSAWLCDSIYPYANDAHVDTALRMLQKEFKL